MSCNLVPLTEEAGLRQSEKEREREQQVDVSDGRGSQWRRSVRLGAANQKGANLPDAAGASVCARWSRDVWAR